VDFNRRVKLGHDGAGIGVTAGSIGEDSRFEIPLAVVGSFLDKVTQDEQILGVSTWTRGGFKCCADSYPFTEQVGFYCR
jgi:hypothetical protein